MCIVDATYANYHNNKGVYDKLIYFKNINYEIEEVLNAENITFDEIAVEENSLKIVFDDVSVLFDNFATLPGKELGKSWLQEKSTKTLHELLQEPLQEPGKSWETAEMTCKPQRRFHGISCRLPCKRFRPNPLSLSRP
mgnify:CR=1 FL=1